MKLQRKIINILIKIFFKFEEEHIIIELQLQLVKQKKLLFFAQFRLCFPLRYRHYGYTTKREYSRGKDEKLLYTCTQMEPF